MPIPSTPSDAAALLGVGLSADRDTIRDRYRRLARIYHPDANPDDDAAGARMLELNAAVDLLLGADTPTVEEVIAADQNGRSLTTRERRRDAKIRSALQHLPYGVYVIGTVTPEGTPNAMVADWVMQVSFRPRILCVSFERDAASLRNLRETRQLTVNLLPESGMDLAARFLQPSDPSKIEGRSAEFAAPDKMRGVPHQQLPHSQLEHGAPVLEDSLAWVAAEAQQFIPVGEHILALCRVFDGDTVPIDEGPLTSLYTGWHYGG